MLDLSQLPIVFLGLATPVFQGRFAALLELLDPGVYLPIGDLELLHRCAVVVVIGNGPLCNLDTFNLCGFAPVLHWSGPPSGL